MAQQPTGNPADGSPVPSAAQPAGQAAVRQTPASPATPETKPPDDKNEGDLALQKLGPGDLVEISVYNVPKLQTKARVNNSGDLYLPLIDYVHVEGLTPGEAQALIQKRLDDGGFVRNPHVTLPNKQCHQERQRCAGDECRA